MTLDQAIGTAAIAFGLILAAVGLLFLLSTPPMDRDRRHEHRHGRHRRREDADPPGNGHTVI